MVTVREIADALGVDVAAVAPGGTRLDAGLWWFDHSWAGDEGRVAYRLRDGRAERLACGRQHSENGNMTLDEPQLPLMVALWRAGAVEGDLIAVREWSTMRGREEPEVVRVFRLTAEDAGIVAECAIAADPAEVEV